MDESTSPGWRGVALTIVGIVAVLLVAVTVGIDVLGWRCDGLLGFLNGCSPPHGLGEPAAALDAYASAIVGVAIAIGVLALGVAVIVKFVFRDDPASER